jgi:CheY-like chemotaxis protein
MKPRLLVVDDDEAVLDYLQSMIGDRYDLVCTNAPDNVLRLAREQRPDLILCDIDMPRIDGGEVSAALFADERIRDIPVLFLSALVEGKDQVGGRRAVSKRAKVGELVAAIDALLER